MHRRKTIKSRQNAGAEVIVSCMEEHQMASPLMAEARSARNVHPSVGHTKAKFQHQQPPLRATLSQAPNLHPLQAASLGSGKRKHRQRATNTITRIVVFHIGPALPSIARSRGIIIGARTQNAPEHKNCGSVPLPEGVPNLREPCTHLPLHWRHHGWRCRE